VDGSAAVMRLALIVETAIPANAEKQPGGVNDRCPVLKTELGFRFRAMFRFPFILTYNLDYEPYEIFLHGPIRFACVFLPTR